MKRVQINIEDEKKIITSMITSSNFAQRMIPITRSEYFSVPFAKTLFRWIREFYDKYSEAPGRQIQELFDSRKLDLEDQESNMIDLFLTELNDKYDANFNEDFYYDKAVHYIRKRAVIDRASQAKALAELDDVEKAEDAMMNFNKVMKITSRMINPHSEETVAQFMGEKPKRRMILHPGALGELFGWWERGWYVLGQGVYGSGKTTFLWETSLLAIRDRYRVVIFSLEMDSIQLLNRYYKRLTGQAEVEGNYIFPTFDCLLNQTGECHLPQRTCNLRIRASREDRPSKYHDAPVGYVHCTACRGQNGHYIPEVWFETIKRGAWNEALINSRIQAVNRNYGDCLRLQAYPRYSANLSDINRDLDILAYTENFVPDLIGIDYGDILMPESAHYNSDEEKLNETGMALSRLASERHAMVINLSQVKTAVVEKGRGKHGKMGDASGSARAKYAHTNFVFSLMQTPEEKALGIVRFNVIKNKEGYFNEANEVYVLQQLELSNALVDSELKPSLF
jgi:replicative DNA helicase